MKIKGYIERESQTLAPYAAKSSNTRGRLHPEDEHPFRSPFQRDRDRVIHCHAFRRLEYKTQVFIYHEGDHFRTRLTHSIEVAQISRTIARALGLNEDLSEAIALAHDLGHPPFGHSGENVLNRLMKEDGGFEHNAHSLRLVDELEKRYPGFNGLNLTWETRDGLAKHSSEHDIHTPKGEFVNGLSACLEAQIVDLADEIAYNNHDIDDGISSGMLDAPSLNEVALWRATMEEVRRRTKSKDEKILTYQTIIGIINSQVTDLVRLAITRIKEENIGSIEDVRGRKDPIAGFSPEMARMNRELKAFLMKNLYHHYRVIRMAHKAEHIISELFNAYVKEPKLLPPGNFSLIDSGAVSKKRGICDYIAGMTDRFALNEYGKLFDPFEKV